MGRYCFLTGFLLLSLLSISFSQGFGRVLMENYENKNQFASTMFEEAGEGKLNSRREMMIIALDYGNTGENHNTKGGPLPPPSQPQPAPSPAYAPIHFVMILMACMIGGVTVHL